MLIDFETVTLNIDKLSTHCPYMQVAIRRVYKKLITAINKVRFVSINYDSDNEVQIYELKIYETNANQTQDNPSIKDVWQFVYKQLLLLKLIYFLFLGVVCFSHYV